jgi:hypothetical protein
MTIRLPEGSQQWLWIVSAAAWPSACGRSGARPGRSKNPVAVEAPGQREEHARLSEERRLLEAQNAARRLNVEGTRDRRLATLANLDGSTEPEPA